MDNLEIGRIIDTRFNKRRIIDTRFNKPLILTKEDYEDIDKSTVCWIYEKAFQEGDIKVKDHDHIN